MPQTRRFSVVLSLSILLLLLSVPAPAQKTNSDHIGDVDPFIGVDWGGNTFVGSAIPFGMVKLGPDMETFDGRRSGFGYSSHGVILGFSHLHLSGAQGKYGNILVAPVTGPLDPSNIKSARSAEVNTLGYYMAQLSRYNVKAELTSSRRVGFHRYTFPASAESHVTLNVASALDLGSGAESQRFLGAELHVTSKREAQGVARFAGGWNEGGEYDVFYYLLLDTPAKTVRTWTGSTISAEKDAIVGTSTPIGASFDFTSHANQVVQVKVGISFISVEQARQNVQEEIPAWNFDGVHAANLALWRTELAKLDLKGETDSQRRQLYTAMYHIMLMPTDRTGENPGWKSNEPYYDDYYTVWDTFRSSSPLLTLISPNRQRDIIRSLIDIYRHIGYMPDGRSGNDNGRTQGGSNSNVVIADAYVKGLRGIDYETAFQSMVHDAEVPPANAQKEGRGGLKDYNDRGFVTLADERSGSRTVEYAYDDFAISEVACGLGKTKEAALYASRARNFEHLFDPDLTYMGFKGFLRPRKPDGSWAAPYYVVRGTWPDFFYEGDLWTYSLYAPQDMRRIIELTGGDEMFLRRLDFIFSRGHFDVTNEPGFLMPTLYNYAGRPDKSADIVRYLLEKAFTDSRAGIPGNDDSGAMSSWLIFQTLGIYPVAGQGIYLISAPSIPDASLALGNGKKLHLIAKNLDREGLNHYVQSVTLNGVDLPSAWFRHDQIKNGATLVFTMGSAPSNWGRATPPPSMSDPSYRGCPALTQIDETAGTQAPAQVATSTADNPLKLNQIQVIGTHNSYHAGIAPSESELWQAKHSAAFNGLDYQHQPLTQQFDSGVRQIELDVYADTKGGLYAHPLGPKMVASAGLPADPEFDPNGLMSKPGFKVMHVQDIDYRSTCQPFIACLQEVRQWSQAHPAHVPIFILVETKQGKPRGELQLTVPEPFTSATFDALDAEIHSVFPPEELITPDDVRGQYDTLNQAVLAGKWPTLSNARGKVVFLMDQRAVGPVYLKGHPSLRGRSIFTNSIPGAPDAAFTELNEGPTSDISKLVRQGYLVRARTDSDTKEARVNDTTTRDAMMASGAQLLSTDYPASEPARWPGHYFVAFPNNVIARCNPLNASAACNSESLK